MNKRTLRPMVAEYLRTYSENTRAYLALVNEFKRNKIEDIAPMVSILTKYSVDISLRKDSTPKKDDIDTIVKIIIAQSREK